MIVDLHVLAAGAEPGLLVDAARKAGLDGVCLVAEKALPDPALAAAVRAAGLKAFLAAAVPVEKGQVLAIPPDDKPEWNEFFGSLAAADASIMEARNKGCAVVACHPYHKDSPGAMGDRILQHVAFDAVIVVTTGSPRTANDMALDCLDRVGAAAAGGSAVAGVEGKAATLFLNTFDAQDRFVAELQQGDFWAVTLGPEDRWSPDSGSGGGDRDRRGPDRFGDRRRGRGGRDRDRRGGRDRGGRGGRDRDRRGGGDRFDGPRRDHGERVERAPEGAPGGEAAPRREGAERTDGQGPERGERRRRRRGRRHGGPRPEGAGNAAEPRAPGEPDGNRRADEPDGEEVNGNRIDVDTNVGLGTSDINPVDFIRKTVVDPD